MSSQARFLSNILVEAATNCPFEILGKAVVGVSPGIALGQNAEGYLRFHSQDEPLSDHLLKAASSFNGIDPGTAAYYSRLLWNKGEVQGKPRLLGSK